MSTGTLATRDSCSEVVLIQERFATTEYASLTSHQTRNLRQINVGEPIASLELRLAEARRPRQAKGTRRCARASIDDGRATERNVKEVCHDTDQMGWETKEGAGGHALRWLRAQLNTNVSGIHLRVYELCT
jgi:hypothetical protein